MLKGDVMRRFVQHFDNNMRSKYTMWKGVKCPSCGQLHSFADLKTFFDEECNRIMMLHCEECGRISKLKFVETKQGFGDIYIEVKI